MTTTPSNAAVTALALLVHEIRPQWDQRGIAWAIHKLADHHLTLADITIAFTRGALDATNDTPAALIHLDNHAWESHAYPRCRTHPLARSRRTNGECGDCYADRKGHPQAPHFDRRPPTELARQARAELHNHRRDPMSDGESMHTTPDEAT